MHYLTGSEDHIILNELSGQLTLGYAPIDYESGDREFSLTVRAVDNPNGPPSNRHSVGCITLGSLVAPVDDRSDCQPDYIHVCPSLTVSG